MKIRLCLVLFALFFFAAVIVSPAYLCPGEEAEIYLSRPVEGAIDAETLSELQRNGQLEINPELFTAIDSQKKSALTCFYHDISEEKLKPLSTKGRKNPLGYQLACFWDCQSSPVTGFIYSS